MLIEPEISGASIVLLGSLNPKIFTPDWFAHYDLLTTKEADSAEVAIIHPQVTKFRAGWLNLTVEINRFVAETTDPPIRLRDFVVRTFREYLPHTPSGKLGINRQAHFTVGSIEKRDQIGHKLAPPNAWGEWAAGIRVAEGKFHGGMRSLTMRQSMIEGRPAGYVEATVEASSKIANEIGIYVQVNDHYEVENPESVLGCGEVIGCLEANFEKSIKRSVELPRFRGRLRICATGGALVLPFVVDGRQIVD